MTRRAHVLALTISAALLLDATSPGVEFPLTVENCGRQVTFAQRPERVLSVGSRIVDQVYAAGAADRIVARAAEFDRPYPGPAGEAVQDAPILSPEEPSLEQIIGAEVDLVLAEGLYNTPLDSLSDAGIPVLIMSGFCGQPGLPGTAGAPTFDDVYADIELYGRLFGTEDQAAGTVAALKQRVAAAQRTRQDSAFDTAAAVYFLEDTFKAYGNQSMSHTLLDTLGLDNAFADLDRAYDEINIEAVLDRDPEVLVVVYGVSGGPADTLDHSIAALMDLPGAKDLQAVRNHRIVGLFYNEAGPELSAVDGLERLADQLAALT